MVPPETIIAAESSYIIRIVVALLAGMLIGIEREKARAALARDRKREPSTEELVAKEYPGIRTFSLIALYSAIVGALLDGGYIDVFQSVILLSIFGFVIAIFTAYRLMIVKLGGVTTIIVMLVDFLVGFLAGLGLMVLAVSLAVLSTFMLAIKIPAEKLVGRISYEELLWALEFAIILLVVGPIFMGYHVTVYGISPRNLYLFFVLVLALSYVGYIATRIKGGEGIVYTALLGGFANSEATIASLLDLVPVEIAKRTIFNLTILINTSMILRNLLIAIVVTFIYTNFVQQYLLALTPFILTALIASMISLASWPRAQEEVGRGTIEIENPLRLGTALKSTLLYLVISLSIFILQEAGLGGLLLVSGLGGLVSSSATILAIYTVGIEGITPAGLAVLAIIATIGGVLNKPIYSYLVTRDNSISAKVFSASLIQSAILFLGVLMTYLVLV